MKRTGSERKRLKIINEQKLIIHKSMLITVQNIDLQFDMENTLILPFATIKREENKL